MTVLTQTSHIPRDTGHVTIILLPWTNGRVYEMGVPNFLMVRCHYKIMD